eukprot:CAMPEP_0114990378 /NCGR_PEP_ID=MMETSP0216-20121206/10758_1 /TAXON_ID=223996 /ORGANISM="Protocruzia adherens, Strain Boccale" /LENGTH=193 /DNA_ID=CAMNT_0002353537 /DNA_START=173 /DNA_END=754 /DNA_ORIENTATION=+
MKIALSALFLVTLCQLSLGEEFLIFNKTSRRQISVFADSGSTAGGSPMEVHYWSEVHNSIDYPWSRWTLERQSDGTYCIFSGNRHYFWRSGGNNTTIDAQSYCGSWEKWTITYHGQGFYSIRNVKWGGYAKGNERKLSHQTFVGEWERFYLVSLKTGGLGFLEDDHRKSFLKQKPLTAVQQAEDSPISDIEDK